MANRKIQDFFNGRFFEIPKYQRGYAWERQNIRDLFDDITESIESNSNHYIGTIVLSRSQDSDDKFHVVDGQQRITTITLIKNALIKALPERDSYFYERFYIKEDDNYRLSPLGRDRQFFFDILSDKFGEPRSKSQRYLLDAVEEIGFKVSQIPDKLKYLKSIEKLEIMEFVENSEGDAIRIFQTVNDRGKLLSNMEKAKSLLIYFSNRYLGKALDDAVNDHFSDIFEIYDDVKHLGDELNITLIKNRDFNEDNLMRYHFVSYSNLDYDPSANYVLQFLKNNLTTYRNEAAGKDYSKLYDFILNYSESLKHFFECCRTIISRAKEQARYYKLFSILNLSATLYPPIIKLEMLNLLEHNLSSDGLTNYTIFDLIELIDVRIYKTRGTDPKSHIAKFTYDLNKDWKLIDVENWLRWFNSYWMSKEQLLSNLSGNIYGNRALNHIFIDYCESLQSKPFTVEELKVIVSKSPNIEHILSQTPKFSPRALKFRNAEDFLEYEGRLGNLTLLERSLNSSIQNKSALDKIDTYGRSLFKMTKKVGADIDTNKGFTKTELENRTQIIANYCLSKWWC
jgi:uncharacterized protein with ParB-like and HNH nuclease domain